MWNADDVRQHAQAILARSRAVSSRAHLIEKYSGLCQTSSLVRSATRAQVVIHVVPSAHRADEARHPRTHPARSRKEGRRNAGAVRERRSGWGLRRTASHCPYRRRRRRRTRPRRGKAPAEVLSTGGSRIAEKPARRSAVAWLASWSHHRLRRCRHRGGQGTDTPVARRYATGKSTPIRSSDVCLSDRRWLEPKDAQLVTSDVHLSFRHSGLEKRSTACVGPWPCIQVEQFAAQVGRIEREEA